MDKYMGLTDKEAETNKLKYGSNKIENDKTNNFISLLIESLGDPIIKILLIALMIKTVFLFRNFDWFETLGILIAIFIASFISSISEYGSEKAFKKLQEESTKLKCKVIRDGVKKEIYIDDVVKEDLIILNEGDKVPADGIILEGCISVDESSINGESKEVYKEKLINKINDKCKLYKGTIVYSGEVIMKVTDVGVNTFYGKIALELKEKTIESPLKLRLRQLAKIISTFGYIGAFLASVSYLFVAIVANNNFVLKDILSTITNLEVMINHGIYALTLSVTIIIVSVPEGLPMMITLVLSSNMKKMIKNNVLVRKMVGIETAGNINILFSDKTGTLTTGNLTINKIVDGNLNEYEKEEDIKNNYKIIKASMVLNNMSYYFEGNIVGGNATDKSLLSFFQDSNIIYKKLKTIPFNSNNKYMITVIDSKEKNLIKGAPEAIINKCKYTYDANCNKVLFLNKSKIQRIIKEETLIGSRVIALATSNNIEETLFKDLTFVGIIIIKDEIRKEAYDGINLVNKAGVKTIMITGDNKDTAMYIATKLGLITNPYDIAITSEELNNMSDSEVKKILPKLKVVSRSLPQDKSRLVRIAQEMSYVVGMTGDGVNDAPALKKADVGFSMGTGSDVSKEASDIIILDNNFLSISKAILYGRTIFKSIRKFIIFQLTVNFCALSVSIIGPLIGVCEPVTVIQMLWINMVMDTLAGLAFSFEPALLEYMYELPKKKDESIINSYMANEIIITGIYTTTLLLLFLKVPYVKTLFNNQSTFMTAFFGLFIFAGIFNCFNAHTSRLNVLAHLIKNKMFILIIIFISIVQIIMIYYGGSMFRTVPLSIMEFIIMLILSFTVIPFDILRKKICKSKGKCNSA